MFKSKPIGWITAGTVLCVAGVALACRLSDGGAPTLAQGAEINSESANDLPDVARAPVPTRPAVQGGIQVAQAEPPAPTPPSLKIPTPTLPETEARPPVEPPPPEKPAPLAPPLPATASPPPEIKEEPPVVPAPSPTLPPTPQVQLVSEKPEPPVPSSPPPVIMPMATPPAPPVSDPTTAVIPVRAVEAAPPIAAVESPLTAAPEPKKPAPPQTEPSAPPPPSTPPVPAQTAPSDPVSPTLPPTPSTPKVPPARQETQEERPIQPLPVYRLKPVTRKVAQPLTGTFPVKVEQGAIVLPRSVAEQLGGSGVLLFTPGPDRCLWLTSRDTAKRLMERLEKSSLPDREVRNFRRIYFGESEKASLETGGRVVLPARLTTWAGFGNRLVLVGVDDHFELWDEGRWQSQVHPPQVSQTTRGRMQDTD